MDVDKDSRGLKYCTNQSVSEKTLPNEFSSQTTLRASKIMGILDATLVSPMLGRGVDASGHVYTKGRELRLKE